MLAAAGAGCPWAARHLESTSPRPVTAFVVYAEDAMERTGWWVWAAIAAGSAIGGVARHLLTEWVTRAAGAGFPWGTVVVNIAGSIAIGVIAALVSLGGPGTWSPVTRHAIMTGLLGGFTTFSTFSIQTLALLQQGQLTAATVNVLLSVLLGLAGCWAGYASVVALAR